MFDFRIFAINLNLNGKLEKTSRETLGKFFYDLAKISFTALVVGSVVSVATQQEKVENWVLILIGIFVTYIFHT